ncbi:MAG: pilus assembly protein TadD [Polaromonas sp.]|nr:pilus assembly protein TadD [Polaromonas sp.]
MSRKIKTASSLTLLGMLLGCAQMAVPVSPVAGTAPAARQAPLRAPPHEAVYASGRLAHGAGQLALASRHYEKVLALNPNHVGALNALAVIHAQLDRSDEAFRLFDRARQLAPGAAHIHNNAGYALMRAGRLEEAEPALKLAVALDPQSARTRQNLALLASAQAERAPVAVGQAPEAAPPGLPGLVVPRLVKVSPQVYSLELPATAVAAQAGAEPAIARNSDRAGPQGAWPALKGIRLEVANGAGIARLARRTADRLEQAGVATARLTNAMPYLQTRTEIQFARGHEAAAQALQSRLPLATVAMAGGQLPAGMQLRLVLGHDASSQAIAAWLEAAPVQEAAIAGQAGWRWS